jgi:hypothetical protein
MPKTLKSLFVISWHFSTASPQKQCDNSGHPRSTLTSTELDGALVVPLVQGNDAKHADRRNERKTIRYPSSLSWNIGAFEDSGLDGFVFSGGGHGSTF